MSDTYQSDVTEVPLLQESFLNALYSLAATGAALKGKKKTHALAGNDSVFQDDANTSGNAALAEPYCSRSAPNTCRACAECVHQVNPALLQVQRSDC